MFGVYLSILLKTFVGISPVIVDLFMGKTLIVFFSSSLSITSSKNKEFSAACVRLFNPLYTLKISGTFHNFWKSIIKSGVFLPETKRMSCINRPVGHFVMVEDWAKMSAIMVSQWQKISKLHWLKHPKTVPKNKIRTRK